MAQEPFSSKFRKKEDRPKEGPSIADAIAVLEKASDSPRAQALLKSLHREFDGSNSEKRPAVSSDSPGMKAARGAMSPTVLKHAKGENQPVGQGSEPQR